MKKKFNFWVINFFLMATASFFLNGEVLPKYTGGISLSKSGMGILKLSVKNRTARAGVSNSGAESVEFHSVDRSLLLK